MARERLSWTLNGYWMDFDERDRPERRRRRRPRRPRGNADRTLHRGLELGLRWQPVADHGCRSPPRAAGTNSTPTSSTTSTATPARWPASTTPATRSRCSRATSLGLTLASDFGPVSGDLQVRAWASSTSTTRATRRGPSTATVVDLAPGLGPGPDGAGIDGEPAAAESTGRGIRDLRLLPRCRPLSCPRPPATTWRASATTSSRSRHACRCSSSKRAAPPAPSSPSAAGARSSWATGRRRPGPARALADGRRPLPLRRRGGPSLRRAAAPAGRRHRRPRLPRGPRPRRPRRAHLPARRRAGDHRQRRRPWSSPAEQGCTEAVLVGAGGWLLDHTLYNCASSNACTTACGCCLASALADGVRMGAGETFAW